VEIDVGAGGWNRCPTARGFLRYPLSVEIPRVGDVHIDVENGEFDALPLLDVAGNDDAANDGGNALHRFSSRLGTDGDSEDIPLLGEISRKICQVSGKI
jgi:hypothetical protein